MEQGRQDIRHEPGDCIDIGPVIHCAGKNDWHWRAGKGGGTGRVRRKKICVHTVAHRLDHIHAFGRQALKERSFAPGHKKRAAGTHRERPLVGQETPAFTRVHPRQRPAVLRGILRPLGRVNIDEIHQQRPRHGVRPMRHVLRHHRRKNHGGIDLVVGPGLCNPRFHARIPVITQAQGLTAQETSHTAQLANAGVKSGYVNTCTHGPHGANVLFILGIVNKGAQEYPVLGGQMFEQVVRTDLVALVRREWQAVDQVQQVGHCSAQTTHDKRAQPIGQAYRHTPPSFDQQLIFCVGRVVLRNGVALVEAIFVMQGQRNEAPVFLECK